MPKGLELWIVEKILDKRVKKNGPEYLVKWKNYPESENSWEPLSSFHGTDYVDKFEKKRAEAGDTSTKIEAEKIIESNPEKPASTTTTEMKRPVPGPSGAGIRSKKNTTQEFSGLTVETIVGIKESSTRGTLDFSFAIKFVGENDLKFVPRKVANKHFPLDVVNFYEERMQFLE